MVKTRVREYKGENLWNVSDGKTRVILKYLKETGRFWAMNKATPDKMLYTIKYKPTDTTEMEG